MRLEWVFQAAMQIVENHLNSAHSNFIVGQRPASDVCREPLDFFQPLLWGFTLFHFIFLNTQQLHIHQDANESEASLGLHSPINFNKQNARCPLCWLPPFPGACFCCRTLDGGQGMEVRPTQQLGQWGIRVGAVNTSPCSSIMVCPFKESLIWL